MNCPVCGKEMEGGWLHGKAPLLWSPKEKKVLLIRSEDEVHVFNGKFPRAHICKECRKVVVEY